MKIALVFPYGFGIYSPPTVMTQLYSIAKKHGDTRVFDLSIMKNDPLRILGNIAPNLARQLSEFTSPRNIGKGVFEKSFFYTFYVKNRIFRFIRKIFWNAHLSSSFDQLKSFGPDVIAISIPMACHYPFARELTRLYKQTYSESKVIYGGYFITQIFEDILKKDPNVDFIIPGTNENVFEKFLEKMKKGKDPKKISGVAFMEKERMFYSPASKDIRPVAKPDFSWVDWRKYPDKTIHYGLSRGCIYNCKFCTVGKYWGDYERMDLEDYIENLKKISKESGITSVDFTDSTLNNSPERIYELCNEIQKQKLKISWLGDIRAQNISEEIVSKLEKSGCKSVVVGIESGSDNVLKLMKKGISKREFLRNLQFFENSKIIVATSWLLGFPGETIEQTLEGVNFALELLNKGFVQITQFTAGLRADNYNCDRFPNIYKIREEVKFEELTNPTLESRIRFYWNGLWIDNNKFYTQKFRFSDDFINIFFLATKIEALTLYTQDYKKSTGLKKLILLSAIWMTEKRLIKIYRKLKPQHREKLTEFYKFKKKLFIFHK